MIMITETEKIEKLKLKI